MSLFQTLTTKAAGYVDNKLSAIGSSIMPSLPSMSSVSSSGPATSQSAFIKPTARPEYKVTFQRHGTPNDPKSPNRAIAIVGYLPEDFSFQLDSSWEAPFSDNTLSHGAMLLGEILGRKFVTQSMSSKFWVGSEHVEFGMRLQFIAETGPNDLLQPIQDLYTLCSPSKNKQGFFIAPGPKLKLSKTLAKLATKAENTISGVSGGSGGTNPASNPGMTTVGQYHGMDARILAQEAAGTKASTQATSAQPSTKVPGLSAALQGAVKEAQQQFTFEGEISMQIGNFLYIPDVVIKSVNNTFKTLMTVGGIPLAVEVDVSVATHQIPSVEDVQSWFV